MVNNKNIEALTKELDWFVNVLNHRFEVYFQQAEIELIRRQEVFF